MAGPGNRNRNRTRNPNRCPAATIHGRPDDEGQEIGYDDGHDRGWEREGDGGQVT